jgi:hypothetical protein
MGTDADLHLMDFWTVGDRYCLLVSVNHQLELRLYEKENLVGLQPCTTGMEALEISRHWRETPPLWPPF